MEIYSVSDIFFNYHTENISADNGKSSSFADILDSILSELEDKYCFLCGSMIEEDGSCPLCGVPVFISGNGRSRNQNISQVNEAHMIFKYKSAVFPKISKIGCRG